MCQIVSILSAYKNSFLRRATYTQKSVPSVRCTWPQQSTSPCNIISVILMIVFSVLIMAQCPLFRILLGKIFFRRTECFFVFAFLSFLKGEIVIMGDFNAVDDRGDRVRKTGITPSKSTPVNLSVLSWWLGDNGRVESFTALWLRSYLTPPGWIGSDRQHLLLPIYMKISLSTNSLFNKV